MLAHRCPFPPDRGDRVRSWNILQYLSKHVDVSLGCVDDEPVTEACRAALDGVSKQWVCIKRRHRASLLRGAVSLLSGSAVTTAYFAEPELVRTVLRWHKEKPFDVVLTYCTGMWSVAQRVLASSWRYGHGPPHNFMDLVDVDSLKWRAYAQQSSLPKRLLYTLEARRLAHVESGRAGSVGSLIVCNERERDACVQSVKPVVQVHVIRNGVALPRLDDVARSSDGPPVVTFVGVLDYLPNVQGLSWFVSDVWPAVRRALPDVSLRVVGRDPSAEVMALGQREGVNIVGPVDSVQPELARATVVIVPLKIARGVQNKVLEAMAAGKAVVCTPEVAQGIDATDGEHLYMADGANAWAERVVELLRDESLRDRIGTAGRQRVAAVYDWEICLEKLPLFLGSYKGQKLRCGTGLV